MCAYKRNFDLISVVTPMKVSLRNLARSIQFCSGIILVVRISDPAQAVFIQSEQ